MKIATIFFGLFFTVGVFAAGDVPIALEHVRVNVHDTASIMRGAKLFAGTCMTCHTMVYMARNKIAKKAGITLDKMPLKNKEWWLGVVPPDLTLVARERSPDWLYTYFHSFYKDPKRPTGYNNLLVKNTVMTNIFASMQGTQEKLPTNEIVLPLLSIHNPHYYQVLRLEQAGSMSPQEFDDTTTDLVNFLVYAGDPTVVKRESMGVWVLLFLAIFFVLAYLLKRIYWKNIK